MSSAKVDTAELRALLAAGTPGEWTWELDIFDGNEGIVASFSNPSVSLLGYIPTDEVVKDGNPWTPELDQAKRESWERARRHPACADAALIVAAVNALPSLLDELDALRAVEEAALAWAEARGDDNATTMALLNAIRAARTK